jgi:hypothetical protein
MHLTERVLPHVPTRQWVLSLPRWARWALARDPSRISRALDAALKAIFTLQRHRARGQGLRGAHCVAISFVQRFGDSLNLNVHFHCVFYSPLNQAEAGYFGASIGAGLGPPGVGVTQTNYGKW